MKKKNNIKLVCKFYKFSKKIVYNIAEAKTKTKKRKTNLKIKIK
jgi:hypothetical protein